MNLIINNGNASISNIILVPGVKTLPIKLDINNQSSKFITTAQNSAGTSSDIN